MLKQHRVPTYLASSDRKAIPMILFCFKTPSSQARFFPTIDFHVHEFSIPQPVVGSPFAPFFTQGAPLFLVASS